MKCSCAELIVFTNWIKLCSNIPYLNIKLDQDSPPGTDPEFLVGGELTSSGGHQSCIFLIF